MDAVSELNSLYDAFRVWKNEQLAPNTYLDDIDLLVHDYVEKKKKKLCRLEAINQMLYGTPEPPPSKNTRVTFQ
ncbi:PhopGVORF45-like protein [Hyphantria cunea granulovirus]|uniref:PhopGVORF45-like protein n=1 Tax=Hyphantria cunea granulovirus TaxID=307448 RepID=A0AAE6D002_9BBAC|nr:PhopGVORF45-like protein [Hyphantria cunea granulovirus]QBQ01592.1 PhopGVORF45-like protein [Hyphantria cunea granulovirus]